MPAKKTVETVEAGEEYYHVRFRNPDEFDEIRTPDWAANVAGSVIDGAEVHTGDEHGNEDWEVQSVLVPMERVSDTDEAARVATHIVEKMDS